MKFQLPNTQAAMPVKPSGWQSRPWGGFQALKEKGRFKVRHLVVTPGASLRLQSHFHRAEHWIVVSGSGRVVVDGDTKDIYENESILIPIGIVHSLENHGKVDLHLIEVQTGAYLGEDDIVVHEAASVN